MADTHNAHKKEVKVEDLLRLKRAERPSEAFWNTFDRELHQRMLQTLVKKDPWYVQVVRGISGRIAQTAAVGAAAAFLALMVVRTTLVDSAQVSGAYLTLQETASGAVDFSVAPVELTMSDLDSTLTPDYQIVATSGSSVDTGYTKEYSTESFEVASYDRDVYAMDTAAYAGTGLAITLVY